MRRMLMSIGGAALMLAAFTVTVAAAGPGPGAGPGNAAGGSGGTDTIATILGLTQAQIADLRQDGLSLAQIAERQGVDPQKLVDALVAQWSARIDVRVANGALTTTEAATLRTQLETRARDMVYKVTAGGMQGAAVGAGPHSGAGPQAGTTGGAGMGQRGAGNGAAGSSGNGTGTGTCDGTGPHGAGRR
jgi:hypothetical protein